MQGSAQDYLEGVKMDTDRRTYVIFSNQSINKNIYTVVVWSKNDKDH